MVKKVVSFVLSLAVVANLTQPIYAANLVALPQNARHSVVPFTPVQNRSTELSFEAVESKISDIFKPVKKDSSRNMKRSTLNYKGYCGDNVVYEFTASDGILAIYCERPASGVTYNYSGLETPWWSYKDSIKSLVIASGITEIGNGTFQYLTNLGKVSIPSTVTSIGSHAFVGCSSLTSITIPNAVTSIGGGAFHGCHKLSSFTVPVGNQNYSSIDGVLFSKDGKTLVQYPYAKSNSYTIPYGVTSIGEYAFVKAPSLTSVTIPSSVTSINYCAFCDCESLTEVTYKGTTDPGKDPSLDIFYNCNNILCLLVPTTYTSNSFCGHPVVKGNCPARTPTRSLSPTRSRSPLPTRSRSPHPTRSLSPLPTRSRSFSPSPSSSPSPTRSRSPLPTRSRSPHPTRSLSPLPTRSRSFLPSPARSPSSSPSCSPSSSSTQNNWFVDNVAWMASTFTILGTVIGILVKYDKVKNFCRSHCRCCHKESETIATETLDENFI